ncbi:adenosylcobalamin-dependent ribonucleoside-diphosphate reductase [Undibacterium sp. RTI2.1]|uniref:adenosylcobalamin-dependent ribonucleoside-diphosphate reductase n=1 Tax=unclassified Undibacterium TaxID=2630295 RepID=UPI002B22BCB5|nr:MULTISPECIES: adenosylcobalamin-dependent ribonucleoside-diphosphate reductase [unclassified Undibacterium]MEB0033074.1 adenosylcobalamin-dependent ribonucleoside-diphosphate reductase [Undibacterium sp. RTI2.1]MEB0118934.1 adenosylcobalamin-dependent ribonucleoside-diphosphate reductase [Undibacterium sp. RTI2.2]
MNARDNNFASTSTMPPQEISLDVLKEKYAKGDEQTILDVQTRVASALSKGEDNQANYQQLFLDAQLNGFVPAGRINSMAGMDLSATLINCFVQPVGDSVSSFGNGKPGIYRALEEAAETMRRGGGVGYDFSSIRPKNSKVKGTNSRASGPISFMQVFNASCATVESAGARRGAQMGILRWDHPDIEDFISAKSKGDLTNFNISIGVTDEFMHAVGNNDTVELVHDSEPCQVDDNQGVRLRDDGKWVHKTIKARDLWEKVMQNTYAAAEPGVIFLSQMNKQNNLYYCETIEATNPCAEQGLPDYGCCCLGSMNLTKFVVNPFEFNVKFDFKQFIQVVTTAIRMLDNVLDCTAWPLPQQKQEAMNKRRVGLGFMGLGSALVMMGIRYDSNEGREFAAQVSKAMRDAAYRASIELAKEKGPFILFDADKYLAGEFVQRLPADIKNDIRTYGIRNSHLLSIAPTGTISLGLADNISNGIEPAFSWVYNRKKRMADETHQIYEVADHAWRLYRHLGNDVSDDAKLPKQFVTALNMSAFDHMEMLSVVQPFIDSAISKTVNVPADYPYEDFVNLYTEAWKAGLKGLATYRPNSVLGSVLSVSAPPPVEASTEFEDKPLSYDIDPLKKQFEGRPLGDLQSVTSKVQYSTFEGKKTVYLTVSFIPVDGVLNGKQVRIERPFEFFMPAGQKNDGQQWITASMRLLSMAARSGGSIANALEDMREVVWDKGTVRCGSIEKEAGQIIPLHHESEVAAIGYALQRILIKRGFLDASGGQIPVNTLSSKFLENDLEFDDAEQIAAEAPGNFYQAVGKKCGECSAYAVQKVDGCDRCANCNFIGSCG